MRPEAHYAIGLTDVLACLTFLTFASYDSKKMLQIALPVQAALAIALSIVIACMPNLEKFNSITGFTSEQEGTTRSHVGITEANLYAAVLLIRYFATLTLM